MWKDLRRELRGRDGLQAGLILALLFLVVGIFTVPRADDHTLVLLLFLPLVFAVGALAGRGAAAEADRNTIDLLRIAPVPLVLHGVSRTIADLVVAVLIAVAASTSALALWGRPFDVTVIGILLLCLVGLVAIASLTAAMAAESRARELLAPLLLVPIALPLLHAGIEATLLALAGAPGIRVPLLLMAGYDLLAIAAAYWLWPHVLEGA